MIDSGDKTHYKQLGLYLSQSTISGAILKSREESVHISWLLKLIKDLKQC